MVCLTSWWRFSADFVNWSGFYREQNSQKHNTMLLLASFLLHWEYSRFRNLRLWSTIFWAFYVGGCHSLCKYNPWYQSVLEETTQSAKCSSSLWQSRSILPSPSASSQQSRMQRSMEWWPGTWSWHKMRVSINVSLYPPARLANILWQ